MKISGKYIYPQHIEIKLLIILSYVLNIGFLFPFQLSQVSLFTVFFDQAHGPQYVPQQQSAASQAAWDSPPHLAASDWPLIGPP
jgi:hypothetical protein